MEQVADKDKQVQYHFYFTHSKSGINREQDKEDARQSKVAVAFTQG